MSDRFFDWTPGEKYTGGKKFTVRLDEHDIGVMSCIRQTFPGAKIVEVKKCSKQ